MLRQTTVTLVTSHVGTTYTHSGDVITFCAQRTRRAAVARCVFQQSSQQVCSDVIEITLSTIWTKQEEADWQIITNRRRAQQNTQTKQQN